MLSFYIGYCNLVLVNALLPTLTPLEVQAFVNPVSFVYFIPLYVVEVNLLHPLNTLFPILVTLFVIAIEVKLVQSANAPLSILRRGCGQKARLS